MVFISRSRLIWKICAFCLHILNTIFLSSMESHVESLLSPSYNEDIKVQISYLCDLATLTLIIMGIIALEEDTLQELLAQDWAQSQESLLSKRSKGREHGAVSVESEQGNIQDNNFSLLILKVLDFVAVTWTLAMALLGSIFPMLVPPPNTKIIHDNFPSTIHCISSRSKKMTFLLIQDFLFHSRRHWKWRANIFGST